MTAVVLGGGISGLSFAYYLANTARSRFNRIILLESQQVVGGWVKSDVLSDGGVCEQGPRSVRCRARGSANTIDLIDELGLGKNVVYATRSNQAVRNRYIYYDQSLQMLPNSISGLMKTKLFKRPLLVSAVSEIFKPSQPTDDDTIYSFAERRWGSDVASVAVDAMVRGIYGGSSAQLSARACFGDLFDWEQEWGSVARGMLATSDKAKETSSKPLFVRSQAEKWSIWSLKDGLHSLPMALEASLKNNLKVEVKTGVKCRELTFVDGKALVKTSNGAFEADHVVSSIGAKALSDLLPSPHQRLASYLGSIGTVSVAVVTLDYKLKPLPVEGFGYLVPSKEKSDVLGVIFDSCLFSEHKSPNTTRLTAMMGGAWFEELFGQAPTEATFVAKAKAAISVQLGISEEPVRAKCSILKYYVGHYKHLSAIESHLKETNLPLSLIGSSYRGVSINDCILNAKLEANKLSNT